MLDINDLTNSIIYKESFERTLTNWIEKNHSELKIHNVYKIPAIKKKVLLLGMSDDESKFFVKVWRRGMAKKYDSNEVAEYIWISKNLFTF